jgi:hypothetical protein
MNISDTCNSSRLVHDPSLGFGTRQFLQTITKDALA